MDIFAEIKKLNFPSEKYVVFGGAALAARGIKETHDIDILVTPELLETCEKDKSWKLHPRSSPAEPASLSKGMVEVDSTIGGSYPTDFSALRKRAEIINGIPFCDLNDIIHIKQAYGREKDLKGIELIKKFLNGGVVK